MGIETAIDQTEIDPVSWKDIEGRGRHHRERFPWEHGSQLEMWRGRIGILLFGAFLAWLVLLSNAQTIIALRMATQQFGAAIGLQPAPTSAPSPQMVRSEPAPRKSPPPAPSVSQRIEADPPRVQLGSYSSEAEALVASEMMRKSYGTHLVGQKLTISAAVVRQVQFYRVVIDLQSEREARDLCDAIKKEKKDCLVWTATAIENANKNP